MTFDEHAPIYLQIAERVRKQILSGALPEGEKVSSTNEYARHFQINPATVGKAFSELVAQGVLYKRRGLGMFVTEGAREHLLDAERRAFFVEYVDPMVERARLLGVPLESIRAYLEAPEGSDRNA